MSAESNQQTDKDNLACDVYDLLWKHEHQPTSYGFKVPNTVVFKNAEPVAWVFSNANNQIKKKTAEILTIDNIKKFFYSINNVSGISAQYIYEQGGKIIIKYLKSEDLEAFIDSLSSRPQGGILQQFIDPNTHRNAIIRGMWSPQTCAVTKQTNNNNIYNQQIDVQERACTYDGAPLNSEQISLKGKICTTVKQCINEIQSNIILASEGTKFLKRMACYFKLDEKENIYFLWSNSLNLEPRSSSQQQLQQQQQSKSQIISKSRSFTGKNISQYSSVNYKSGMTEKDSSREANLKRSPVTQRTNNKYEIECYQCNQYKVRETFININYKSLIEYQLILDQQDIGSPTKNNPNVPQSVEQYRSKNIKTTKKFYHIPRVLQIIHPNLKYPTYASIKDNPQFYNKQTLICSSCYYEIMEKHGKISKENQRKAQGQPLFIMKRSISVGNSRPQKMLAHQNVVYSDQKQFPPYRLISALQRQKQLQSQDQNSSPSKFIEDDSECSKPTVFVQQMEKLSMGVHALNGFSSIDEGHSGMNNSQNNHSLSMAIRQKNQSSEANLQTNLRNSNVLQQSQYSWMKSQDNSNGFVVMKKTYSAYTCFEEGMDAPQKTQVQSSSPFQTSDFDKISTIYSSSERQSWRNENLQSLPKNERNEGDSLKNSKKISVKGYVESQHQLHQHDKQGQMIQIREENGVNSQQNEGEEEEEKHSEQNIRGSVKSQAEASYGNGLNKNTDEKLEGNSLDQKVNIEDITLFNLIKPTKEEVVPKFGNQQRSPEYSNTPTFQITKANTGQQVNGLQSGEKQFQKMMEQSHLPYQYRLSFGNQGNQSLFYLQQNKESSSALSDQKSQKLDDSAKKKVSAFIDDLKSQKQRTDSQKQIEIQISDEEYKGKPQEIGNLVHQKKNSIPRSEGYQSSAKNSDKNDIQSEKAMPAQNKSRKESCQKDLTIIEQIIHQQQQRQQLLDKINIEHPQQQQQQQQQEEQQQNEVETFQDSIISEAIDAENESMKSSQKSESTKKTKKILVLKNNFTENANKQEQIQHIQNLASFPVKMQNNSNHIPVKERGVFHVKKVQSKSKLRERTVPSDKTIEDG